MGNKKKKYNARFPPARIKKIMQSDEEVGKVAAAVPVIISRALELFVESLIVKTCETTQAKSAKTLTPAHIKHAIQSEKTFDFLKDLVANVPDQSTEDDINNITFPHPNANRVTAAENRRPRAPRGRRKLHGASPGPSHRKARKTSSDTSQIDDEEDDDEDDDDDEDESVSETSCDPSPQTQPSRPSVIVSSPPCSSNGSLPTNYSMHTMAPPAALATAASLLPQSGVPMTMPCSNLMSLTSFNNSPEDDDYDA